VDAIGCRKEKHDFVGDGRFNAQPTSSHESGWEVAKLCLKALAQYGVERPVLADDVVFQTFLKTQMGPFLDAYPL